MKPELRYCPCAVNEPVQYSARARSAPPNQNNNTTSTRHNSTNTDPIQEVHGETELHGLGDNLMYNRIAVQYSVERSTLARRHQGWSNNDVRLGLLKEVFERDQTTRFDRVSIATP
jgi:hypothetical protein